MAKGLLLLPQLVFLFACFYFIRWLINFCSYYISAAPCFPFHNCILSKSMWLLVLNHWGLQTGCLLGYLPTICYYLSCWLEWVDLKGVLFLKNLGFILLSCKCYSDFLLFDFHQLFLMYSKLHNIVMLAKFYPLPAVSFSLLPYVVHLLNSQNPSLFCVCACAYLLIFICFYILIYLVNFKRHSLEKCSSHCYSAWI